MIENDITGFWEMYGISDKLLLHVLRLEDRVASGPIGFLVVYEEDLI